MRILKNAGVVSSYNGERTISIPELIRDINRHMREIPPSQAVDRAQEVMVLQLLKMDLEDLNEFLRRESENV